jgi:hypothetical protein
MSIATLVSQMSLLCAGFYTTLPPGLAWIRHISPMWYSFSGLARSHYRYDDTTNCISGDSDVGDNQCFLEYDGVINDFKLRGMNIAVSYDADSDDVSGNIGALIALCLVLYAFVFIALSSAQLIKRVYGGSNAGAATPTKGTEMAVKGKYAAANTEDNDDDDADVVDNDDEGAAINGNGHAANGKGHGTANGNGHATNGDANGHATNGNGAVKI